MSNPKSDPFAALDALPAAAIPAAISFLSAKLMAAPIGGATTAPPIADELLTPEQAAKLLRVSRKYVYSHVRELGGTRLGKGERARIRFRRSAILTRIALSGST
jgi:excisionase family DNA binding protein